MATLDPTKRAGVSWWDIEGPDRAKLTVAWLDENNREMAWDLRGLDAYWIAQCFKARDAELKRRAERIEDLEAHARFVQRTADALAAALELARGCLSSTSSHHGKAVRGCVKCERARQALSAADLALNDYRGAAR